MRALTRDEMYSYFCWVLFQAITVTITSFITDPLKQIGQGIGEFLRALLKDLPVTLQLPVLLIITLAILVRAVNCKHIVG